MSKTFTSRSTQVSQRGRGRGGNTRGTSQTRSQPALAGGERLGNGNVRGVSTRGRRNVGTGLHLQAKPPTVTPSGTTAAGNHSQVRGVKKSTTTSHVTRRKMSDQPPPQNTAEPSHEQMGGFTVIGANEKKRQQIAEQARKEEEAYLAHQRQKTQQSYSYVGTVGGGQSTEDDARKRQAQAQRNAKLTNLEKQRKWRDETKRKEQEDIDKRLSKAREQSSQNEQRKLSDSAKQMTKWDEDRRRKNEDFLNRLERQSQETCTVQQTGNNTGSPRQEKAYVKENIPSRDRGCARLQQEGISPEIASDCLESEGAYYNSGSVNYKSESESVEHQTESESNPLEGLNQDQIDVILTLQDMFPQYTLSSLTAIADQSEYSLDTAANLLSD